MRNNIILLLAFTLIFSCKNEEKISNQPTKVIKKNEFLFKVVLTTTDSDDFRLLMNDIKKGNSKVNIYVEEHLKQGKDDQTIEFIVQEDYFPQELIIDLGKKDNKIIDIKNILIHTSNHELNIPKAKIDHYFYPNQYTTYDTITKNYISNSNNKNHLLIFRNRIMDSLWINE